jgi:hypothetical protein
VRFAILSVVQTPQFKVRNVLRGLIANRPVIAISEAKQDYHFLVEIHK